MKNITLLTVMLLSFITTAQKKLPQIKSNTDTIRIKCDGKLYRENLTWTLAPDVNPDIFYTDRLGSVVSFHTDCDSIAVKIEENTVFDFIILRGKKKAYTQIVYQEPYLITLKKGNNFNFSEKIDLPEFTYADSSDTHLKAVRSEFKLDSIAGKGSEVSRLLNIMHWLHYAVRHDGSSNNPSLKNALDLVAVCRLENRGVNCRMLATILNECYLSMGFKSRMVTCMPKPDEFDDCHVINEVYSEELQKWIWLDPTFDAYVMNEKGELLGIWEVRERLIADLPLLVNPDANWNREFSEDKAYYLDYYMAKNLYRIEIPIHSTYNLETAEAGKVLEYMDLFPMDDLNRTTGKKEADNKTTGVSYVFYKTTNPELIWGKLK